MRSVPSKAWLVTRAQPSQGTNQEAEWALRVAFSSTKRLLFLVTIDAWCRRCDVTSIVRYVALFVLNFSRSISLGEMHKYLSFFVLHWQGCFLCFSGRHASCIHMHAFRLHKVYFVIPSFLMRQKILFWHQHDYWFSFLSVSITLHNSYVLFGVKRKLNPKP
jgi:hypothetical protein